MTLLGLLLACGAPSNAPVEPAPVIPEVAAVPVSLPVGPDPCGAVEAIGRGCAVDSDCVAVRHTADCCGTVVVWGIAASAQAEFLPLEGACGNELLQCKCEAGPTVADDRSSGPNFAARCTDGRCVSFTAR